MIPEYESRVKRLEEQMAPLTLLEEMEHKVQQLEQELQWAIVIEIEKVMCLRMCTGLNTLVIPSEGCSVTSFR